MKHSLFILLFFVFTLSIAQGQKTKKPADFKKTLDLLQGTWVLKDDNHASVKINKNLWTFNYVGDPTSPIDSFWITITDKLPQFVTPDINAEFLILMNKKDTMHYEIMGLSQKTLSLLYYPAGRINVYNKKN